MRNVLVLTLVAVFLNAQSQSIVPSPLQTRVVMEKGNSIYDTRAWRYFSGSPVRATPLIKGGLLFAGNAKGEFFALDKKNGMVRWKYTTGTAIHSSAIAADGKVFFSDNRQTLYAISEKDGRLVWKFNMGQKLSYPWRYDYYYSSPVICNGKLLIGGDDGYFYSLEMRTGKQFWKFRAAGVVRSTGAIYKNTVLFGDSEATLYALDLATGKQVWQFRINGDTMKNEDFGFDRRAINSSPVVSGDKVVFGARDGWLYCINATNGKRLWTMDHHVSWIISTVAIRDSMVITGTSDGRFVQSVHLESGKEIWKYRTPLAVWASPLIVHDKIYAASFDGQLHCIDLYTGKRISQFKTDAMLLSSPVWNDDMLYMGSDDGNVYAFKGHPDNRQHKDNLQRYVFYEPGINIYFRSNSDLFIRNFLNANGYKTLNSDSLVALLSATSASQSVIVFATDYFPRAIIENGNQSLLRRFLDNGGKVVMTGILPSVYKVDEKTKQPVGFNPLLSDSIFGLNYGHGDTRSFLGQYPSFPTSKGQELGLPDFWITSLFIDDKNVDVVLGRNENGHASAFAKHYANGGQLVQIWMDAEKPERLDAIIKAAEWKIE